MIDYPIPDGLCCQGQIQPLLDDGIASPHWGHEPCPGLGCLLQDQPQCSHARPIAFFRQKPGQRACSPRSRKILWLCRDQEPACSSHVHGRESTVPFHVKPGNKFSLMENPMALWVLDNLLFCEWWSYREVTHSGGRRCYLPAFVYRWPGISARLIGGLTRDRRHYIV